MFMFVLVTNFKFAQCDKVGKANVCVICPVVVLVGRLRLLQCAHAAVCHGQAQGRQPVPLARHALRPGDPDMSRSLAVEARSLGRLSVLRPSPRGRTRQSEQEGALRGV